MHWIPGHLRVYRNKKVDEWAKDSRKYAVGLHGRWRQMDFDEDMGSWMREERMKEWQEGLGKENYQYYRRVPAKAHQQKKVPCVLSLPVDPVRRMVQVLIT